MYGNTVIRKNWSPWRELQAMESMLDRAFGTARSSCLGGAARNYPAVNVYAGEDSAVVTAEVPGVEPDGLDVSVKGATLTLGGERTPGEAAEAETCHRRERWQGRFERTVELPFKVDASGVEAICRGGVLRITLPKAESEKPRKITITSN